MLQKQVDFLETNPDFVVCCHNAKIINENNIVVQERKLPKLVESKIYSELELKRGAFLLTLSMVYRNETIDYPESFFKVVNGDTFLISLLGQFGKGMYLENVEPAVYRVHDGGVWSGVEPTQKRLRGLNTSQRIREYYKGKGDFETVQELDKRLKKISKQLFRSLNPQFALTDYFIITNYYIRYNVFSNFEVKNFTKITLRYFYIKLFK